MYIVTLGIFDIKMLCPVKCKFYGDECEEEKYISKLLHCVAWMG